MRPPSWNLVRQLQQELFLLQQKLKELENAPKPKKPKCKRVWYKKQ